MPHKASTMNEIDLEAGENPGRRVLAPTITVAPLLERPSRPFAAVRLPSGASSSAAPCRAAISSNACRFAFHPHVGVAGEHGAPDVPGDWRWHGELPKRLGN